MPLLAAKPVSAATLAGKYVPVLIRQERYGIRFDRIRGRASMSEMLARTDLVDCVAGFITRRGRLIPVFDLHSSVQAGSVPPMAITILLVQSYSAEFPGLPVGLCVDAVDAPVLLAAGDIRVHPPGFRQSADGMPCLAAVCGPIRALLDLDAVVERSIFGTGSAPTE